MQQTQTLQDQLKNLPTNPGVYRYFDKNGTLLYVGKAKNLKNRVLSYFRQNATLSPRIAKMVSEVKSLHTTITASEADALILENSLIKQLKPHYNILLRDDKTYPYICFDLSAPFPRPEITRKVAKGKNYLYFGPFYKGANEILKALYTLFPLVQKRNCKAKACLFYQIKRCLAPCENRVSKFDYKSVLDSAIESLKNPLLLVRPLEEKMLCAAANERFEEAAALRDQAKIIKEVSKAHVKVDIAKLEDFEIFAVESLKNASAIAHFSVRNGVVAGVKTLTTTTAESNELFTQAILRAFSPEIPLVSTKIYTNEEFENAAVLSEVLTKLHGHKFNISVPKVGDKKQLCDIAKANAALSLDASSKKLAALDEFASFFSLTNLPRKVEVFDNSHLFGEAVVGAMVAWEFCEDGKIWGGRWCKGSYRHFHLTGKSDYEQMSEVLRRRALKFDELSPPDLWLIDGGEALLKLAQDVVASSGANVEVMALAKEKIDAKAHRAKGGAKDKIWCKFGEVVLDKRDEKLLFLQALRDEAHRFAITFHKKKRDKLALNLGGLGVSVAVQKKLLAAFGSFGAVFEASEEVLASVVGEKVARKLKDV